MLRPTFPLVSALAILLGASLAASGQEPVPAEITATQIAQSGTLDLVLAWRFHPGDDPRWADPAFDDRRWETVVPTMAPGQQLPRGGWPGTGWFRRHLSIEPALRGKPLVIRVGSPGTTTVFLDGVLLMEVEGSAAAPRRTGGVWRELIFPVGAEHLLAVRHTSSPASRPSPSGDLGFRLSIERTDSIAIQTATARLPAMLRAVFTVVPALIALLHLVLFLFYPKARENLFSALALIAFAGVVFMDYSAAPKDEAARVLAYRVIITSVMATIYFGLLAYYAVRTRAFPRTWIVLAAVGAALAGLVFLHPQPASLIWLWQLYFGLALVEVIRVEATGRTVKRKGAGVLLGGLAVTIVISTLQIFQFFGLVPPIAGGLVPFYFLSVLTLAVSMSIFLAQSFGRTRLHLDEQELSRRLLEAENARKTAEIEAARALQLSMLPSSLPAVEGLEVAAAMIPASEVGGDYYDFRLASDSSLVVAFGDATGHGVAAGIMVTAVKALFSTLGGGESLPAVLAECGRVLREMHVQPLHMCLTLARLTPRSVTICSAAMPPVLIHRAATGAIEELAPGGPPVGSRLAGGWTERSSPLAPGDTLLFASDGFAEQLDPADHPLGYERLAEAFSASASLPAGEIVARLLAQVEAWRGEREQGDDVTFVVIRAVSA